MLRAAYSLVSTTSPIRLESTIRVMNIKALSSVLVTSHINDDDGDNDDDNAIINSTIGCCTSGIGLDSIIILPGYQRVSILIQ